jgi:hypothetical protein
MTNEEMEKAVVQKLREWNFSEEQIELTNLNEKMVMYKNEVEYRKTKHK